MANTLSLALRRAFSLCLTLFTSFCVSVVLFFRILKNPFTAFKRIKRTQFPATLPAGQAFRMLSLSDINLHCVTAGNTSQPLMLFVHGFPEFWYSWRFQISEFAKDFFVVALDNRGYSESDAPTDVDKYTIGCLVEDVKEVIELLGYKSCILVGHDWGGAIVWNFTMKHPEMVDRLIVLNCPHSSAFTKHIQTSLEQLMKSWYMFLFQAPYLPEMFLKLRDMEAFNDMFKEIRSDLSAEDLEAYKYAFRRPGAFTGPINYYRAMFRDRVQMEKSPHAKEAYITNTPVLLIWGTNDMALSTEMARMSGEYVTNFTLKYVEGASHWVQQEEPTIVNEYMRDFLSQKKDD